jgi:hypothetical protein
LLQGNERCPIYGSGVEATCTHLQQKECNTLLYNSKTVQSWSYHYMQFDEYQRFGEQILCFVDRASRYIRVKKPT